MGGDFPFLKIDHVQLAIPPGTEEQARAFYVGTLGLTEVPKPQALASRGGLWLTSGKVMIHLGVDSGFHPARKAHPALICNDYAETIERLKKAGAEPIHDEGIPGITRCYVFDPFGNRLELMAAP